MIILIKIIFKKIFIVLFKEIINYIIVNSNEN